jgi:hypothetical protein
MHSRALPLLLAALLCGCEPPPPREQLDRQAFHLQVQQLASAAAEADVLAQQLQAQHLNGSFAWVHQQSLSDQIAKSATQLAQAAPPELQPAQRSALQLADELRLVTVRIASVQHDPAALDGLRGQFSDLQAQAHQLAKAP